MEFGWYNWRGGLSVVQYMEQKLLESRQLTPAITDRQLIKKIARHYGREIEVAVVTRDVNTIQNFESLILEYANINQRAGRESGFGSTHDKVNTRGGGEATHHSPPLHNKGIGGKHQPSYDRNSESDKKKCFLL